MKTSTHHFNGRKGWLASLLLAGLVFAALVLTGCPQTLDGGGGDGGGSSQAGGAGGAGPQVAPPAAVKGLTATYDATANGGTVTVNWSAPAGTTALKYQVTVAGKTSEFFGQSASITGIAPTEGEATVTVVGVAYDGTRGAAASTTVLLTKELAVAAIELRANGPASGGSQDAAVSAPGVSWNATVTFTNGGQIASGDKVQLQLYKDGTAEGSPVTLSKNGGDEDYQASLTAPAAEGTYTLKVLLNDEEVPGQTATITVQNPRIDSITLNRTEVRPGYTITGEIKGNEALATVSLQGTVTQQGGGEKGPFYVNSNLKFSYTVPTGTADGTYTIAISQSGGTQSSAPLGTVDFTVKADAPLPSMDNPFAGGNSYLDSTTTWTVQGSHLITTETYYDGTTEENWYTFTHDTTNKRITLTPYKLLPPLADANKALTRAEYEAEFRQFFEMSRVSIMSAVVNPDTRTNMINQIKSAEPGLTGLESMSNDQLVDTYFRVMLKSEGYSTLDEYVTAMIQQDLKVFDVKTTYSYVADGSTGSLVATEWWDPNVTFKTLYDAGSNYRFSYYESGSGGNNKSISIYGKNVSINEGNGGGSTYYTIQSVSGNTINLKADSGGGTATMTFRAITDKASGGSSPQKQMTVTYSGQDYTLTHTLTNYSFTIQ